MNADENKSCGRGKVWHFQRMSDTTHTTAEEITLENIRREQRAAAIEFRLYCWLVMPSALAVCAWMIWIICR
jgi:hypothetical protein